MKRPHLGIPFVYLLTLLLALFLRGDQAMKALDARDWRAFFYQLEPAALVLLLMPLFIRRSSISSASLPTPRGRVIVTTSLLFAIAHATVWPSPVPLFFLALGLGWLAWRTQSIVPGIVTHSLFNAVACVQLSQSADPALAVRGTGFMAHRQQMAGTEAPRQLPFWMK